MSEKNFEIGPETDSDKIEFLRFSSTNPNLKLRMEIEPEFDFDSNRYFSNSVFVVFINSENNRPIGAGGGVFKITSADIPDLDASNRAGLEKSFSKYADSFVEIRPQDVPGDSFDTIVHKIFSDIWERRSARDN